MDLNKERLDILLTARDQRAREVMLHQINIDNYQLAIQEIQVNHQDDPNLKAFATQLQELLESSMREQAKERLLLKVITTQLESPCA